MVLYVLIFLVINALITFLFMPEQGVEIYGTRHLIAKLFGPYTLTQEQLFYQITKFFKYSSVIPLGIIFLLTTIQLSSPFIKLGLVFIQGGLCVFIDAALLP
jgi:energy-coupling factor transport system permease protein